MNILKNLRRRYGRTTLTVTGVALAIAFSIIMLSVGEAIQQSSRNIIEETNVDLLAEPVEFAPLIQEYIPIFKINQGRTIAKAMVDNNSKIRAASPWLIKSLYVSKYPETINATEPPKIALVTCKGTIPEKNIYFGGLDIKKGSQLPTKSDPFYANGTYQDGLNSKNFTHEILISEPLAKLLDVSVGELIYLNPIGIFEEYNNQSILEWFENATWFNITGIMVEKFERQNALNSHIHLSELQYLTGEHKNDGINKIYISLHHSSDRDEVKHWLENEFYYRNETAIFTAEDILKDINQFMRLFEGFSSMVIIITVLIAALFISTILMISTRERTKEIGALRAMGISKFTINISILKESFVICILGLIIGSIIGMVGSLALNHYILSAFQYIPPGIKITIITPMLLIQVTIITFLIALLASLAPSYWASKLNPADTIRNE